jgi:hypothetical protein
LTLDLELREK